METWQIECDLDEVSLATVEWVVLALLAWSIMSSRALGEVALFYKIPWIWMLLLLSSRIFNAFLSFSKSKHLPA